MKLRNNAVILLLFALFYSFPTKAQFVDRIHGSAAEEEVILDIKHIANGETIQVGCIYWNNSPNSNDADALITKVDATGNVIWSRRLTTPLKDRLCRVVVAANGDYIACGYTTQMTVMANGTSIPQRKGLLCRFNAAGTIFWTREWRAPATGPYTFDAGPTFYGLCEMPGGQIAVAGTMTGDRAGGDGLVASFTPAGAHVWTRTFGHAGSNHFRDITVYNNELVAVGPCEDGTGTYDGSLIRLDFAGNHIFSYGYSLNFNYFPQAPPSPGINLNCVWLHSLHVVGGRLYASGSVSSDYNGTLGENSLLLDIDPAFNAMSTVAANPPFAYSNSAFFIPTINNHFIIGQNPGGAQFHYEVMHQPATNYVLTDLFGGVPTSVRPVAPGQKALFTATADVANNNILAAGLSRNGSIQIGEDDVLNEYYPQPLTDALNCSATTEIDLSNPNVVRNSIQWTIFPDPMVDVTTLTVTIPNFNHLSQCDSTGNPPGNPCDTCCPDTCYWTVNGNTIHNGNNTFGTLSNDDVDIVTNNTQIGILSKDGYWGIKELAPATTLHVDGVPTGVPGVASGIRFDNLPQGDGNALVIDANGYVHVAQSHLYKQSGSGADDVQNQIDELKKELVELKQLLGKGDDSGVNSDAGATLTVSPNPTEGEITAAYSVTKSFSAGEIRISDASGKILMTKELTKGNNYGNVKMVLPKNISSEQLICTLVCDGKIIASQKLLLLHK